MRFPLRKRGPITSTSLLGLRGRPRRPTPRVVLPRPIDYLRPSASVLQHEANAAADIGNHLSSLTNLLDVEQVVAAIQEGDLSSVLDLLDVLDWLDFEKQMIETMTPRVKSVIRAEGQRSFDEIRLNLNVGAASAAGAGRGTSPPQLPPTTFGDPSPQPGSRGSVYATGRFDMTDPYAIRQAEGFAADLVREVSRTTKNAIRDAVVNAFREGVTAQELSRQLRNTIGLTARQARSVENYRERLLRGGMDEDRVEVLTRRYYRQTRNRRAQTIARTEIMRASNFGRQQGWLSAVDAGMLDANTTVKEWVTAPKGPSFDPSKPSVCPVCAPMDGTKVMGIETEFKLESGRHVQMPPAHPNCRCTAVVHPADPPEDWDPEYPYAQA